VGENMKSRSGVSAKMFGCLGNNGINIRAIAQGSSEKISALLFQKKILQKRLMFYMKNFLSPK
jgi:aspartokinase/homoserine dehydrogenase 1